MNDLHRITMIIRALRHIAPRAMRRCASYHHSTLPEVGRKGAAKIKSRILAREAPRLRAHAPSDAIGNCYGVQAQRAPFFLSNVCPQRPDLTGPVGEA